MCIALPYRQRCMFAHTCSIFTQVWQRVSSIRFVAMGHDAQLSSGDGPHLSCVRNVSSDHDSKQVLKRKTSSSVSRDIHPACFKRPCASSSRNTHASVLKRQSASSASVNSVSGPADSILPALDASMLQKIRELGHFPVERNNPATADELKERRLAELFRKQKKKLLRSTVEEIENMRKNTANLASSGSVTVTSAVVHTMLTTHRTLLH